MKSVKLSVIEGYLKIKQVNEFTETCFDMEVIPVGLEPTAL